MPILNPSIQYFLLSDKNKDKINANYNDFFIKYLSIASHNLYHNYSTVDASIQFKKDLQNNINFVNDIFGCNISLERDFTNQTINDYYKFLNDNIKKPKASENSFGTYFICKENFSDLQVNTYNKELSNLPKGIFTTNFYHIKLSDYHSWYLTDTPIAILCVNTGKSSSQKEIEDKKLEVLHLIKLEIDLMAASGLTLVLCYEGSQISLDFLFQILKDDQFSELHINFYDENELLSNFLKHMTNDFSKFIKGYIYLYSCFFDDNSFEWMLMQIFRKKPRTKIINYSLPLNEALKKPTFYPTKPFQYCKTGFKNKYIRIYLIYVPISDQVKNRSSKTEVSSISIGYVKVEDFLYREGNQTQILYFDINGRNLKKTIHFNNLHSIKSDLFVNSTLSLAQMKPETHETVKKVENKLANDPEQNKKTNKKI